MEMSFSSGQNRPTAELINIIKDLFYNSNGENTDERDRIIKKVEIQFTECDARIDKYIRTSSKDLSRLIKVFNEIAKKIENSREKVSQSREALKQCKVLLQSKRDDVRRLWLEWCEQKYVFETLTKLKQLHTASENIRLLCSKKSYLEAAELISTSLKMLDEKFREIAGLNEVKRHIELERIKLESYLVTEMSQQLYTTVTRSVLETGAVLPSRDAFFKRRFRHHLNPPLNKTDNESNNAINEHLVIEKLVQAAGKLNTNEINVVEKLVEEVEKNIVSQLIVMINATSNHVLESNLIDNSRLVYSKNKVRQSVENNPKFLCQLIDLTFEQFKTTARNYRLFVEESSKFGQSKYLPGQVWTYVQNVLISLLDEYLDIKQSGASVAGGGSDLVEKMDVNAFFVRKRLLNLGFGGDGNNTPASQQQTQSQHLDDTGNHRIFAFKNSSHSMSINNYIREKNNEDLFSNDDLNEEENGRNVIGQQRVFKVLVCQPDHRNVTTIFATMEHIIKEISDEIRSMPSDAQKPELILEKYLQDFILKTFITNAVEAIKENARIHSNTGGKLEISKQLVSLGKQRELGLNKPILQNIYLVHQSCVDLFNLIKDMSSYASEFTKAMLALIEKHYDYCNKIFLSIVTNSSGTSGAVENYVYSMFWVQDEAIKTYFKQLPAFSAAIKGKPSAAVLLAAAKSAAANNTNTNNQINTNNATKNLLNQNPGVLAATVEIEQFNVELMSKEVETLISNLHDKELEEIDIITNFNYIEMVAHLHESCDWLIIQLKYIVNSLEQMIKKPKSLNNSLTLDELKKLNTQLEELDRWRGDTLLLLYLETRVHCFYHLITFIKQENSTSYAGDLDTDPDDCVLNLNRDLHRIYEHLSRSLQESKVNYVFDALGFMIATIFIRAVKSFKKISKHGIAKMCRNIFHVEQNLSAIRTKSDPHLMKAHRFYELLYKKPEELLNHLIDNEAEFQLNDYVNILNLIYRSKPGHEIHSLADNINSLTNILKNKH